MNTKRPPSRGPRPAPSMKPTTQSSKYYWRRRCYPWYYNDNDYDWYDYDYDYGDWDYYSSTKRSRSPGPVKNWDEGTDDAAMMAYQQGFKDGWAAAMEYAYYGEGNITPDEVIPMPPAPTPAEKPTAE
jgi:hypothetical protein